MEPRYVVAYVVTDVKKNDNEIKDYDYDVTVDVVKRWKLTNIPVRWQHLMPKERSRHSECNLFSHKGIGKVVNWWLDFSSDWNPFAVAVLLEINDPDFLSSPTIDQYRCVSLSYLSSDHTNCVEISLVRTGQRRLTAGQFVPRELLDTVCLEVFGFPKEQYKRQQHILSQRISDMEANNNNKTQQQDADVMIPPIVLQSKDSGEAINSSELNSFNKDNVSEVKDDKNNAVNKLIKEAETVQAILEKIPSKEGEVLLQMIEDRNKRADEVEQKVNKRLETWSVQLRDLLNRFSQSIDGRCEGEIKKRKDDVDKLHRQLDNISDVWKRMELISASFDTVSRTLSSTKPLTDNTRKVLFDSIRKKWPGNVKVTIRDSDEVSDVVDQFTDAIRKSEVMESKRKSDTLDRYLNLLKGQLQQTTTNVAAQENNLKRALTDNEIQWIRSNMKRSRDEHEHDGENSEAPKSTMPSSKKIKNDTVQAGYVNHHQGIPPSKTSLTSNKFDEVEFNYWRDRKSL